MTLFTLTMIWAGLGAVVLALALVRQWAVLHEDDNLYLADGNAAAVRRQSSLARFLNRVEATGKTLTVAVVLYGAALLGRVIYLAWMDSLRFH